MSRQASAAPSGLAASEAADGEVEAEQSGLRVPNGALHHQVPGHPSTLDKSRQNHPWLFGGFGELAD
jgi:hypothetical protein